MNNYRRLYSVPLLGGGQIIVTILIFSISALTSSVAQAQRCGSVGPDISHFDGPIGLVSSLEAMDGVILEAIDHWSSCGNYGSDFPGFVVGRDARRLLDRVGVSRTVEIVLSPVAGEQGKCASFRGRTVKLYRRSVTPTGEIRSCGSLARNLAHELGHVLGLRDARRGRRCERNIMALLSNRNPLNRVVAAEECSLAGEHAVGRREVEMRRMAESRGKRVPDRVSPGPP